MENKEGYIPIDSVVRSVLAGQGKSTLHGYIRLLHWAIKGYKELNLGINVAPETAFVGFDNLKRINLLSLPGFRMLAKVGVLKGDRIQVFMPDNTISKIYNRTTQPFNEPNKAYVDSVSDNQAEWYESLLYNYCDPFGYYRNLVGYYGQGYNGIGYFTYDRAQGLLIFSSEVSATGAYIEYVKDVFQVGSKTMVPEIIGNYIEEYIKWQYSRAKNGDSARETEAASLNMKEALFNVVMRTDNISLEAIRDSILRATSRMQ